MIEKENWQKLMNALEAYTNEEIRREDLREKEREVGFPALASDEQIEAWDRTWKEMVPEEAHIEPLRRISSSLRDLKRDLRQVNLVAPDSFWVTDGDRQDGHSFPEWEKEASDFIEEAMLEIEFQLGE